MEIVAIVRRASRLRKLTFIVILAALIAGGLGASLTPAGAAPPLGDPSIGRDDASPWGIASGAEWFSAYPTFNPALKQAGVRWLRGFYEWQTVQPKQGYWNFTLPDRLIENARHNNLRLTGVFAYFAPWASADGGTRKFPIKDIQFWRDYVTGMVGRYQSDIKYWEVWNEFNGSFAENGTPQNYAELVREASVAAKRIDPAAKIGMSVANFDVTFLDAAIKAGAANHFDFVCVHPYEKLAALANGGEMDFLGMSTTLRHMLTANRQSADMPLWITEIGQEAPVLPDGRGDRAQAISLMKAYLLSIASGFQRVFWFEARGPSYGKQTDFGLIRADMTPRPSYEVLKKMTSILGPEPTSIGWLNMGDGGYGFLFNAQGSFVLAAWAPPQRDIDIAFTGDVRVTDLMTGVRPMQAGQTVRLTNAPQLFMDVPPDLIEQARSNKLKPFPWGFDPARSQDAVARLQAVNVQNGMNQINVDTTVSEPSWRRTNISRPDGEGHYVYFQIDPQFVPYGTNSVQFTASVRRASANTSAGFSINYESQEGYKNTFYSEIPAGDDWHDISWTVGDARFVGAWGWNFRINAISSPADFMVREVRVRKVKPP